MGWDVPRLHPIDFEKNSYTPAGASWPISYEDLQPYYEQAEQALRVRAGKGSKYHPPRNRNYPIPPDRNVSPLESMLTEAGLLSRMYRIRPPKTVTLRFLAVGLGHSSE